MTRPHSIRALERLSRHGCRRCGDSRTAGTGDGDGWWGRSTRRHEDIAGRRGEDAVRTSDGVGGRKDAAGGVEEGGDGRSGGCGG